MKFSSHRKFRDPVVYPSSQIVLKAIKFSTWIDTSNLIPYILQVIFQISPRAKQQQMQQVQQVQQQIPQQQPMASHPDPNQVVRTTDEVQIENNFLNGQLHF